MFEYFLSYDFEIFFILRVILSFIGLIYFSYLDIFNNKTICENLLKIFLGIALIINFFSFLFSKYFFFPNIFEIFFILVFYVFYKFGKIGGADVYILISLLLIMPPIEFFSVNYIDYGNFYVQEYFVPFVFFVLFFSLSCFFVSFFISYLLKYLKIIKKSLFCYEDNLLKIIFLFVSFFILSFSFFILKNFFDFPFMFLIPCFLFYFLSMIIYFLNKKQIDEIKPRKISINSLELEEVLDLDLSKLDKKIYNNLVTENTIKRLKEQNIKYVYVYRDMPAFIPYILIGFLITLIFL